MPHVLTTCPYCGCGCGLYLEVDGGEVRGTAASGGHPVGRGRLCPKGWHAHEISTSCRRLLQPLVRHGQSLEPASWEEALDAVAGRLYEIKATAGPGAVGVLGSPRSTNEESFLLSKLARAALGTNNVDFSARLEALPGLYDLPQYRHVTLSSAGIEATEEADLLLLWQADPWEEHPAAGARVLEAAERGVPVVEVAARSGGLGKLAALRLSPTPGSEVQLAAGLLRAALSDREGAESDSLAAAVDACNPEQTTAVTGVPAEAVVQAGQMLARAQRPLVVYGRGATLAPQGAELLLTLAAFDRASASADGWRHLLWLNSSSNFQGALDMGVVPYFLPGFQPVSDEGTRARFAQAWGAPIPAEAGLPSWDMLGKVRGLFVLGDDPISSFPDPAAAREALSGLDFLVVQDIFRTPTAELADVVLPGASFAEKDGTFTSTERRVQRVRRAVNPPGQARPDWETLSELADRLGARLGYESPAGIMEEISSLAPAYEGLSFGRLEEGWGVRWPLNGDAREDRAALRTQEQQDPTSLDKSAAPVVDEEFPLVLAPDYGLGAWAADTFVANSLGLRRQQGSDRARRWPEVTLNPQDADKLGLRAGARVRVKGREGEMEAVLSLSDRVRAGLAVLPATQREAAGAVLRAARDDDSGAPVLRPVAVGVEAMK